MDQLQFFRVSLPVAANVKSRRVGAAAFLASCATNVSAGYHYGVQPDRAKRTARHCSLALQSVQVSDTTTVETSNAAGAQ